MLCFFLSELMLGFLDLPSRFIQCFNKKTRSSSCFCFPFHVLHPVRLQEPWSSMRYEELLIVNFHLNVRSLNSTVWCGHGLHIKGFMPQIKNIRRFGPSQIHNLDLTWPDLHVTPSMVNQNGVHFLSGNQEELPLLSLLNLFLAGLNVETATKHCQITNDISWYHFWLIGWLWVDWDDRTPSTK